jgi:hypothetical protein
VILVKIGKNNGPIREYALNDGSTIRHLIEANSEFMFDPAIHEAAIAGKIMPLDTVLYPGQFVIICDKRNNGNSWSREPFLSKVAIAIWNISHAPDIKTAERITETYRDLFNKLQ